MKPDLKFLFAHPAHFIALGFGLVFFPLKAFMLQLFALTLLLRPGLLLRTKPINLFLLLAGVILEHTAVDVGSLASNFDSYSLGPALARSNLDFG